MSESIEVNQLKMKLKLDTKPTFNRNFKGKVFPFWTREPERVKYKDDFSEIIGIMSRHSAEYQLDIEDVSIPFFENLRTKVDVADISEEELRDIFDLKQEIKLNQKLLLYVIPKSSSKQEQSEKKGKVELGVYLSKLFKLSENEEWKKFLQISEPEDLYTEVLILSLPELECDNNNDTRKFCLIENFDYLNVFQKDLSRLLVNKKFFLKQMNLFFSFYYFLHIITFTYQFKQTAFKDNLFFSYEKESLSGARVSVKNGYNLVLENAKYLLVDNDVLDYLNELIGVDKYYSYQEILSSDFEYEDKLIRNLKEFNRSYSFYKDKEVVSTSNNLMEQISQLRQWLKADIPNESVSRFKRSFDEFFRLGFIKSRGRLGKVLNAPADLILLLVAVIVEPKGRMLVRDVFKELEKRGIFFDSQSRQEVIKLFEEVNILEKMSDSGDAQYVKSIL
ncbi:DNA phosphorothioation-dependent restriction protein DptG [Vagococcus sp. DIV0080]|uniref:DNA phosphorothioation-dependent restriction protein DptG n=1 Tax=Candidatus Vagococcus giribetii TaxID=2230876 RepID=A0ABS3HTV7_9ENTE|nr:DNA phosphorothioation-dependent restriction protein DptG [Vagococcus sp. DIV0080]MBO0477193.1 DNA phosphorothioation-dependent restriction protein DptG [Vagococcus sp. DIV0080]